VVRQRASQVAAQLNQFGNQITDAETVMRARLTEKVDRVNALASQVADINQRIVAAESSGNESPDMRDQRDAKIDELASLIGASAYPQADGSVNVNIGGDSLVDGAHFKSVRLQGLLYEPTKLGIALGALPPSGDPTETMYNVGGAVSGMLDGYNTVFPDALTALDGVARALVTNTNALHRTGFIGTTAAGDFFDPTRTTARTIRLDTAIENDVNQIASSGASGQNGDNTVALALSQLRSRLVTVNGAPASISEGYRTVVARVAANVSAANGTAEAMRALTSQSDARRESIKGVSLDEEMVNLMKFQQSYAAAARLIAVVDELSQTLINLGR
jgi:flagellar hook-associated protein 1 FlgK